jgi:leader peptidase (prepilin peptidase)/N-methyltransferase
VLILLHCSKGNSQASALGVAAAGWGDSGHYASFEPRKSFESCNFACVRGRDARLIAPIGLGPSSTLIAAAIGTVSGACVGSFIGTALVRMPEGRSLVRGRFACDGCGRRLSFDDLVPIGSWLMLRGRCRTCGSSIGVWQLIAEVLAAAIGFAPWFLTDDPWLAALMVVMGWQLLLLALLDARNFWLPLRLVGLLAATGLMGAIAVALREQAPMHITVGLIGGALGWGALALVRLVYQRVRNVEGLGAGDPWLMGAVGLWLGPLGVVEALLGASLVGIVSAVAMLLLGQKFAAYTALPLGTCVAAAAWPLFCLQGFGWQ